MGFPFSLYFCRGLEAMGICKTNTFYYGEKFKPVNSTRFNENLAVFKRKDYEKITRMFCY